MFDEVHYFYVGVIVGGIIVLVLFWASGAFTNISELGQSICEEQYHMNYVSYNNGKLTCEPKTTDRSYGKIIIDIGQ